MLHIRQKHIESVKRCWALAWPVSLQGVMGAVLGMIDVMMVGGLGNEAVASVGLASRAQFVLIMAFTAFGVAASVLSSQYFGAQKREQISTVIGRFLLLGGAFSMPVIALTMWLSRDIMMWATHEMDVVVQGTHYLWITLPTLLPLIIIQIFEGGLRGVGQVRLPLVFGVIAMVVNIILNEVFIHGGLGIAAMGVKGAALATDFARIVQLGLLLTYLIHKRHLCLPGLSQLSDLVKPEPLKNVLSLVAPMSLNFTVWASGTFVYQLIYASMGTEELATVSMLAPVEGLIISLFVGFSSAASILVGQKLGANDYNRAFRYGQNFTWSITLLATVVGTVLWLASDWILMPYKGASEETLSMAKTLIMAMAFGIGIKTLNMMLSLGVLRAGGDNGYCLKADTVGMWFTGIPITWWVASTGAPLHWVFIASLTEEIAKAILFCLRMYSRKWMKNLTASHA